MKREWLKLYHDIHMNIAGNNLNLQKRVILLTAAAAKPIELIELMVTNFAQSIPVQILGDFLYKSPGTKPI